MVTVLMFPLPTDPSPEFTPVALRTTPPHHVSYYSIPPDWAAEALPQLTHYASLPGL